MAFLIPTNAVQIARFANGLYGVQLGFASTNGIVSDVGGAGLIPTFNNYYSLSFGAMTTAAVAQQVITNLGIVASTGGLSATAVSAALAYVTAQLNAAAPAARGAAVKAVFDMWSSISADAVNGPIYGTTAATWNSQISKAVQYAGAVNPDLTIAAAALIPAAPNSISLSTTTDNITGNPSASNQISAIFGTGATANFNPGDNINPAGTSGNSITLSDNGTGGTASPTGIAAIKVSNIQTAIISSGETLTVDTNSTASGSQGWTGLTSLTVSDVGTTGNNTTVNAAATTDINLNETSSAATTATVTGGRNLNINVSGNAAASAAGGALTIGGSTAALQPVGTVSATLVTSALAGIQTSGAITSTGGTVVVLTQSITAPTPTTTAAAVQNVTTAGNITVTGTANTTAVTATQTTAAQQTVTVNWQAITSAGGTETITVGANTLTVTGVANTTSTPSGYTAQQVAAVAAGAIIPGLTLNTTAVISTAGQSYTVGTPSSAGATVLSSQNNLGAGQVFPTVTASTGGGGTPTLTAATGGILTGTVAITDVNGASATAAGTITSVTLNGLSLNLSATTGGTATITANSLQNLTVSNVNLTGTGGGATVTLTNNLTAPSSTAGLNLAVSNIGSGGLTLVDTNAELRSLNITTNSASATNLANTVTLATGYSKVASITVAGNNTINIASLTGMFALSSLTVTGGAGLITATTNTATSNSALTSITSSSSGFISLSMTGSNQSFTSTGSGADYISINGAAGRAITAGTAPTNAIIWNGTTVPTSLTTTGGSITGFNKFAVSSTAVGGTYNMATLVPATGTFSQVQVQGGNNNTFTFSNVPVATPFSFDLGSTATTTYSVLGITGATATLPLTIGQSSTSVRVSGGLGTATPGQQIITGLTLTDSLTTAQAVANGIGTLTVTGNASRDGQVHIISTLTDTSLSTVNNSGNAGLQIGVITSDAATSLTWNNTSPSVTASGLTGSTTTWNNLNSITLTGTGPIALSRFTNGIPIAATAANDVFTSTSAAMTITNTNTASTTAAGVVTATPAIVNFTDLTIATLTFAGTAPITSTVASTSSGISIVNNNTFVPRTSTGVTVDAQNVNVSFNDTSVNSLIISGTGKTFVNTIATTTLGLLGGAGVTSFNLTDTNTGAVQIGPTITALQGGLPFANSATTETLIQSGSGTLQVNQSQVGDVTKTITLVGGVAFNYQSTSALAFTLTAASDTAAINLGISTAAPMTTGGAVLHSLTLGSGTNVVFDGHTAVSTNIFGTATGIGTNTYINTAAIASASSFTFGNGNNNIIFSSTATPTTAAMTITVGSGANTIALGRGHTVGDSIVIAANSNNGPNFTNVTTIANIGAAVGGSAVLADTNLSTAATFSATTIVNTLTLASITGVAVGASIIDTTAGRLTAGTVIRSISGNTVTLSAPILASIATTEVIQIGNQATGGNVADTITFANAAINGSIASQGATPVASIAAGVSAAQQSAAGYSNFVFGPNFYIYENTGFAATSELIALVGIAHTYTVNGTFNIATITV